MHIRIPKTRRRKKKKDYGKALDRIIDKYSATPQLDPEHIDYSMRPTRKEIADEQLDEIARTYLIA